MTSNSLARSPGAMPRRAPSTVVADGDRAVRGGRLVRLTPRRLELGGLAVVLALATLLNLFRIAREGYANTYYAAAVKSMTESWHNFFFVAFDPGGFVSVDKPPLGFWIQAASAKLFGFHGWSLLLPEAIAGLLSVFVLYRLVRRAFGPLAGLLAGLGMAVTPVAVAVSRNNTIDSLLVLTVLLATWAVLRATETGRLRWLVAGMALVGLGFNIKMMQAYLALPALVLLYLLAAPHGLRRRVVHLAVAGVALVVVSFAWIAAVDLTPADQRPYVGSSQNNSALELALGYNGVQRLLGMSRSAPAGGEPGVTADGANDDGQPVGGASAVDAQPGGQVSAEDAQLAGQVAAADGQPAGELPGGDPRLNGGGGPGGVGENGAAGPLRLIDEQLGGQASWLLPLSVLGAVAALGQSGWRRRRDPRWQSALLWAMWLVPAAAFFSVAGFFHRYYLVMLAPPIAALAGIALATIWRTARRAGWQGWLLIAALPATAAFEAYLLRPYPEWSRWLTPAVLGLSVAAAVVLAGARLQRFARMPEAIRVGALALGIAGVFLAPGVWSWATTGQGGGGLPAGGPSTAAAFGAQRPAPGDSLGERPTDGTLADGSGAGAAVGETSADATNADGAAAGGIPAGMPANDRDGGPSVGMPGGFGQQVDDALIGYLEANRDGYRYLVATPSAQSAAAIILQTGEPVMAMGGFAGSDPILTTDDLEQLVADGTVRYFLVQGGGMQNSTLVSWITSHGTAVPASAWGGTSTGSVQLYEVTAAGAA